MDIHYRKPDKSDLRELRLFVDYWLSGRARGKDKQLASNDYFISTTQLADYLTQKHCLIALDDTEIVGWAVVSMHDVLVHILVNGNYRGLGIGSTLLKTLRPKRIRSKSDQGTGDPAKFYENLGFRKAPGPKTGKNQNIEMYDYACN